MIGSVVADEKAFDFTLVRPGQTPPEWQGFRAGRGEPSRWEVIFEDAPSAISPLSSQAPQVTKRAVIAQTSTDPESERFPVLAYEKERYGDFTFSTRFKLVSGQTERMAGIAFRIQDEKNFYVVRVDGVAKNIRFYKFVNGERTAPLGPNLDFDTTQWHELKVTCNANRIEVFFDDRSVMPAISDPSFPAGKIGLFTKSDSVSHFTDLKVEFTPLETLASSLVRWAVERYPRLLALRISGKVNGESELKVLGSKFPSEVGSTATAVEKNVLASNQPYYGVEEGKALITFPLHDRNGDVTAVAKFTLQHFKGQTEANAIGRIQPMVREMEKRIAAARDLVE